MSLEIVYHKRVLVTVASPWKHLFMFAGLRSALSEEIQIRNKTRNALEHAFIRAFYTAIGTVPREICEGETCPIKYTHGSNGICGGINGTSEPTDH